MRTIGHISKDVVKGFEVILVEVTNHEHEFIEYYVGVPKTHPAYIADKKEINTHYLKNHIVHKECFTKMGKKSNSLSTEVSLLIDVINKGPKKAVETNKLKAIDSAWLSYIGHDYSYLDDNLCYYGGGMSATNFGQTDAVASAGTAMNILVDYFKEME